MTVQEIKNFVLDTPHRCADIHLASTAASLTALALSYHSPAILANIIAPQRWTQISTWAPLVGVASLAAMREPVTVFTSFLVGGFFNAEPSPCLYQRFAVPISADVEVKLQWVNLLGIICQIAAVGFAAASFTPYVQNKAQARLVAATLTTCFNTIYAVNCTVKKSS